MADPILPADLLHLLCAELADQGDFSTLYHCAISSKDFAAAGALSNLYKISNNSSIDDDDALPPAVQELDVQRHSILWRTIILSSLGKTMFPYCRYLRALDLRKLHFLLDDEKFRGKILKNFFSGPLAPFDIRLETPANARGPKRIRLNTRAILLAVGDAITKQSPLLEVLTEPVVVGLDLLSTALSEWPSRMPHLQSLQLGDGRALSSEKVQDLLIESCPNLNKLEIYQWTNEIASDSCLARFLLRMRKNGLTSFQNESDCGIGSKTCQALARHAQSLTTLHLSLSDAGLPGLGHLRPCTKVSSLALTDLRPPHDLRGNQNDVFNDVVAWLHECTQLLDITLTNFVSAPSLLTPVLEHGELQLEDLQVNVNTDRGLYIVKDHQSFHQAISRQKKLTSLLLTADADGTFGDDVQTFCDYLCELKTLKSLTLTQISEYFTDIHIDILSQHLTNLEELTVDGYGITDASLERMASLPNLKSLVFNGLTTFTLNGLLDFVERLGPGNERMVLTVWRAQVDGKLSSAEEDMVREALAVKVNGRFEYHPVTDPDVSEFEGSDSD